MRIVKILCAFGLSAGPAWADACREEIAGLFLGGVMDPFARPPHVQYVEERDADGATIRENINYFETPLRTIAGASGNFTLAIDTDIWNGPSPEGPWSSLGTMLPIDRGEKLVVMNEQQAANVSDTTCHGTTDEGVKYSFRSTTDPDENGVFFGAMHHAWIDPDSNLITRLEMTEFVNSWSEGVSTDTHVIRFEYDPNLKVMAPE